MRERAHALPGEPREIGLAQLVREVLAEVREHVVDARRREARRIGFVRGAREQLAVGRVDEDLQHRQEQHDAPQPPRVNQLGEERLDRLARARAELHAAARVGEQRLDVPPFGEAVRAARHERLAELHDEIALGDRPAFRHVAHPVVRQVRSHQHEIAGAEAADIIADEHLPRRLDDQMHFELRMKVPPHRAVRVAMRPRLERLAAAHVDDFEIGLHTLLLVSSDHGARAAPPMCRSARGAPSFVLCSANDSRRPSGRPLKIRHRTDIFLNSNECGRRMRQIGCEAAGPPRATT
ncbi:Uncharacterised protein [Burkholderia pseudomallei]|nr:Uncharacterised protein [Burkholderia pseudomallei]